MKKLFLIYILLLPALLLAQTDSQKTRLIILADMGNEPDEEQQMMHLLMCSNEVDLEGLIAVTGKFLQPGNKDPYRQVLHPELFDQLIDGYEKVYPNLLKHAPDYPKPDYLRSIVASGQKGYGIEDSGPWKSSEGSMLIERALNSSDPRPVYVVVNAGSNTLAQALIDYRSRHTAEELKEAVAKLRVYENGAQDNSGAWICHEFPEIHWFRSNFQAYCYGGPGFEAANDGKGDKMMMGPHTWKPYSYSELGQHQWALEHIMMQHGPFGPLWPLRSFHKGQLAFIEGGGTVPWLCLVNRGLSDIDKPWWGGWSGRSTREKVENYGSKHESVRKDEMACEPFFLYGEGADNWKNPDDGESYEGIFVPVWRWRQAFFNDFICRMDWCVKSYQEANHHPNAVLNGDSSNEILFMQVEAGEKLKLNAAGSSDPDGDDLVFNWLCYPEAGTYDGAPKISSPGGEETSITIPKDAAGKELHIILEVKDQNEIASLWDYRRLVIQVGS
jgi:hypothetical protein